MVLPGAHGPWAPGSVADCQTSDWACGQASAQGQSRSLGRDRRPPAAPVTCPGPAARPRGRPPLLQRARARRGL